ncbi:DUF748 domain-containing protein [Microbulbifer elongatus]|uniref:DUF748 domain-containing protein n=1 Tax=Microbulbifer elongatus TaxID=86173 RepID=UPI001CFD3706|nr:DUF748 domain-containing protein [Microbulbifer elongatus]
MSTSPANKTAEYRGIHRLLWLLVFFLLLIGALNIFLSIVLPGAVQRWLHERGLEARIEHMDISLPSLSAHLRGVEARNEFERGFSAEEATLGLSWWQLLQGKIHVKRVDLVGAYMDLESEPGKQGRVWEIGGWRLKEGGVKPPRNWRVDLTAATLRDTTVCYQHKPQWNSPSCVRMGFLALDDFFVAGLRENAGEPLQFSIGADDLALDNLLGWDDHPRKDAAGGLGSRTQEPAEGDMRRSPGENPNLAIVRLKTRKIRFERPGNLLTVAETTTRKIGSCPPARWAEAIPGLRRVTGHCGTARRLQVRGPASFSFGRQSEIAWHRINGQELRLRYSNRRHPNWHAETIAINDFDFLRQDKSLQWQSAGASGFSWCPSRLRSGPTRPGNHHYCIRAGSVRLPQPTTLDWLDGFRVDLAEASLVQGTVIDRDADKALQNPLNVNHLRLGALQYRNDRRRLQLQKLSLDGATGCIPGQLWGQRDHCVLLHQLGVPEDFALQFPREVAKGKNPAQTWALESGPLVLEKFRLGAAQGEPEDQLSLTGLDWSRVELAPGKKRYLLEDVTLDKFAGCMPEGLLPQRLSPLCGRLQQLQGKGDFVLALEPSPYLVLGELTLASLLLSDHLSKDPTRQTGLELQQLHTGTGFFRVRSQKLVPGEYFASEDADGWFGEQEELPDGKDGVEKGRLSVERLASENDNTDESEAEKLGQEIGSKIAARQIELELASLSLSKLDGCLPLSWQALAGGGNAERRPECFSIHNLRQQQPLNLAVATQRNASDNNSDNQGSRRRVVFSAAELTVESANVKSAANQSLFSLSQLRLPNADFRLQSRPARLRLALPGAALDSADFCFGKARCVDVTTLRTGDRFSIDYGRDRFSVDLKNLELEQFSLSGSERDTTLEIDGLHGLDLQANLPRTAGARADWTIGQLQARAVDLCLPAGNKPDRMLPRCVRGKDLNSDGGGLTVVNLALHHNLDSPAQLKLGNLQVEKLGLVQAEQPRDPVQLNLHNLRVQSASGCGLNDWLAAAQLRGDSSARWRGCLSTGELHLSGDNLISLGSPVSATENNPKNRVLLGPLRAAELKLTPVQGEAPILQLAQLRWQSLGWPGGARVQVEDLNAVDFFGCLPGTPGSEPLKDPLCIVFGQLQIAGSQRLGAGEALRANGQIALEDFVLRQGGRKRIELEHMLVSGLVFSTDALQVQRGQISGLSGCLGSIKLAEKPHTPCYEVASIQIEREHNFRLSNLRSGLSERSFHNIRVEGFRITQHDYPADLPAQLLYIDSLQVDELGIGRQRILGKNLQLNNVRGCIPQAYIKGIHHCIYLQTIQANGHFDLAQRRLQLDTVTADTLKVQSAGGDLLLETEYAEVTALTVAKDLVRLMYLGLANSKLFRRDEGAQEFVNHPWNTEFERLSLNQFEYVPGKKILDINTIELVKPRSILARGPQGDLGAWERFRSQSPPLERYRFRRQDVAAGANRFRYRISEVYVDRGHFLWLDNRHDYQARLPVRHINLLLRGLSNYPEDAPGVMVFNGSPGGYSDMQLAGQIDLLENNHWNAQLLGYVEGANLIPATPYIANLLGYKILQGQLDAVMNVKVDDNMVDALAKMELQKIKVRRVRDSDNLEVKSSFIPLSLALALLKDGNGDVRFEMPVTGDLYDPEFSLSFIFSDLLQRAILEALFAYFTPVGFYSLAKLAWARFRAVSFSDLEFSPGSDTLSEAAKAQLNGMVAKMRDNPKARPGICGVATARDLEIMFPHETGAVFAAGEARDSFYKEPPRGIREELLRLSHRRSREVQKFLIEAGLDQEDFIQCAPDYIGTDSDAPRVEFSN